MEKYVLCSPVKCHMYTYTCLSRHLKFCSPPLQYIQGQFAIRQSLLYHCLLYHCLLYQNVFSHFMCHFSYIFEVSKVGLIFYFILFKLCY